MLLNAIAEVLVYYFTVHDHDEGIAWMALIFAYITTALVFWSFHRIKVARIRQDINEGEEEWSSAVTFYVLSTVLFYAFTHMVDRIVHDALRDYARLHDANIVDANSLSSPLSTTNSALSETTALLYHDEKEYIYANVSAGAHILFLLSLLPFSFFCLFFRLMLLGLL